MRNYIGLIHKDADSDFGVSFPDFPGVATAGDTWDDARAMAEEALALHVEGLLEDSEPIPEPSTLEQSCPIRTTAAALPFSFRSRPSSRRRCV
jgi:predicted RNase H-like HicB family nuclease